MSYIVHYPAIVVTQSNERRAPGRIIAHKVTVNNADMYYYVIPRNWRALAVTALEHAMLSGGKARGNFYERLSGDSWT